jgi:hypothetical protein
MDTNCESLWKDIIGKLCILKGYARFDEGELEKGYGCDTGTLTDERVRNGEHKLQPVATAPALYSTQVLFRAAH